MEKTEMLQFPLLVEVRIHGLHNPHLYILMHILHTASIAGQCKHFIFIFKAYRRYPLFEEHVI